MSSWYKITLPMDDCGIGGKSSQMQEQFHALMLLYTTANSSYPPWDAAMFSERSDDFSFVHYYISPSAVPIVKRLLAAYGATPCVAPPNRLTLFVGDAR